MMKIDQEKLEQFSRSLEEKIEALAPEPLKSARDEVTKTIRLALDNLLQSLDVVTREEFEVQTKLLERTRETLDALDARLSAMEPQSAESESSEEEEKSS